MEREHTLQWLDFGADEHSEQELSKIQREWDADHFDFTDFINFISSIQSSLAPALQVQVSASYFSFCCNLLITFMASLYNVSIFVSSVTGA